MFDLCQKSWVHDVPGNTMRLPPKTEDSLRELFCFLKKFRSHIAIVVAREFLELSSFIEPGTFHAQTNDSTSHPSLWNSTSARKGRKATIMVLPAVFWKYTYRVLLRGATFVFGVEAVY